MAGQWTLSTHLCRWRLTGGSWCKYAHTSVSPQWTEHLTSHDCPLSRFETPPHTPLCERNRRITKRVESGAEEWELIVGN